MHSFATFARSIGSALRRVEIGPDTRMLIYPPLAHVAEHTLVEHGLLACGMQVYFAESLDTFAKNLKRLRPTVSFSVPRLCACSSRACAARCRRPGWRLLKTPILCGIVAIKVRTGVGLDASEFAAGGAAPMGPGLLA